MTPRRVLMTTDAVGGVWTYSLELARGLSEAGVEVMLAVIGPPPNDAQRDAAIAIPGLVLVVPGLELEWGDPVGPLNPVQRQRLAALTREFEPDLVHCNGFREAAAGFRAPVVAVAHSCVRTWWRACRGDELPSDWSAYADGVRTGLAAASVVVAPSVAFGSAFDAAWDHGKRCRVIRNGLDIASSEPGQVRSGILAAGRLRDEAKNVALLASVAHELPWPIRLAGEAPPEHTPWPVEWLGVLPRDQLLADMHQTAIFAAPARYEPFGLAILEAAASGCALILGRIPTLVELWANAAHFVPVGDGDALRRSLLGLIGDPAALQRAQAAARRRARAYSRRQMVDAYLGLYGEVMEPSDRRGRAA
jgi:glycosyltransferase involved in cell wall biosynthesis